MNGWIVFLIVVGALYVFVKAVNKGGKQSQAPTNTGKSVTKSIENDPVFLNDMRIIQDCIRIINNTKKIDTGLSRFGVMKDALSRAFDRVPAGFNLNLNIGDIQINTVRDLHKIDQMKADWLAGMDSKESKGQLVYNQALAQWAEKFNQAVADDVVTEDELMELESLQEKLNLSDIDTAVYWKNCTALMPTTGNDSQVIELKDLILPDNSKWELTLTFGESKSNVFNLVKSSIEIHPSYKKYTGPNGEDVYEVTFTPTEMLQFNELWQRVKTWKSAIVKINGEIVDRKALGKMLLCFRDKLRDIQINQLFCYGASPFTFNLFGCHRSMLRDGVVASQKCWYHIGRFDNNDVFHVDKVAIKGLLARNLEHYRICPALDVKRVLQGLDTIPDTIHPRKDKNWTIETDFNGNRILMPTPIYKVDSRSFTERVGNQDVTLTMTSSMIDHYASISPQFNALLEKLFNLNKQ